MQSSYPSVGGAAASLDSVFSEGWQRNVLSVYIDRKPHKREIDNGEENDCYWKGIPFPDSRSLSRYSTSCSCEPLQLQTCGQTANRNTVLIH